MGKITDFHMPRIMKTHELDPDEVNKILARMREDLANNEMGCYLPYSDLEKMLLYLATYHDVTETLEEEIGKVGGATGDARRAQRALERENVSLMEELTRTRKELADAKVSLEVLAELNAQLFNICQKREHITTGIQMLLDEYKARFHAHIRASSRIANQWELVVGNGYVLQTYPDREKAQQALDILVGGLGL